MEVHAMLVEFSYPRAKSMEFAYPLFRRALTTSMSWRRFLNSVDCGLESAP